MGGMPSRGGPPETISSSGTVWRLKSVRHGASWTGNGGVSAAPLTPGSNPQHRQTNANMALISRMMHPRILNSPCGGRC